MKYALPTDDGKTVGKVFGRAMNFAIYDDMDSSLTIVENAGTSAEHGAGTGSAAFLAEKGVGAVFAPEVGPKAEAALQAAAIRIERADGGMELAKAVSRILSRSK